MNFKFRPSMNNHPHPHPNPNPNPNSNSNFPPPSNPNFSYFTQQAIRVGLRNGDPRAGEFGYPVDMHRSIEREMEKERIRAEIIAEEIMWRKSLEQEVRRELMMERDMMFRRGGLGGGSPGSMRGAPSLLTDFVHPRRVVEHVSPLREVGFRGGIDTVPFQRDPVVAGSESDEVRLQEIKEVKGVVAPISEVNQDKVIILAKPSANLADVKRKAMAPTVSGAVEILKKQKTKEDWSCALCRVTATSERGLNEHLQGKKHKACERGMITQRMGFGTGPLPKTNNTKAGKPYKVLSATSSPSLGKEGETDGESSTPLTADHARAEMGLTIEEKSPVSLNEASVDKKQTIVVKKQTGAAKAPANGKPKKKFRYYCEACQVGAFVQQVFNAHMEGKRHLARMSQVNKSDEVVPGEASTQMGGMVENKATEEKLSDPATGETTVVTEEKPSHPAAGKTTEAIEEEQADTKNPNVNGDVDRVKDVEMVSETLGDETITPKSIDQVTVCNEA